MQIPKFVAEGLRLPLKTVEPKHDNRSVILAGIAAGFLGKPRFTADANALFLLSVKDLPRVLEPARADGIPPRIPDAADFVRTSPGLLLRG